jgi:putative redox protein
MITTRSSPERYHTLFADGARSAPADTPSEKGGAGAGFRPHALLEAALATCIDMTVRMAADKYGIPLTGVQVTVTLNRSDPEAPCFEYTIELEGDLGTEARERLYGAASRCPVRRTLSRPLHFRQQDAPMPERSASPRAAAPE